MAAVPLPGSYPDSVPATPEETMHHPLQSEQHSRQPNKLHKPGDPRGHKYMDSGVGMTDPDPIITSHPSESNEPDLDEAVGGGAYTWEPAQPIAPLESIRTELDTSTPTPETQRNAQIRDGNDVDLAAGTVTSNADSAMSDNVRPTRDSPPRLSQSAPYWGDLPKGTEGGLYNTVTGHGSSTDDHDEHHKLRPKSAERKSVITGNIADYPRGGGVYNTVAGHGSQDDESRRHSRRRSADNTSTDLAPVGTGHADDTMLAAPLPDIPEEKPKTSHPATLDESQGTAAGFLPETAVRDDARLLDAVSRHAGETHAPPKPNTTVTQRAFPLAAASVENRDDRQRSPPQAGHGSLVGVVGAGAAPGPGEHRGDQDVGSASPRTDKRQQGGREAYPGAGQTSPVQKTRSHEEESPKAEKKHKLLGIFHRHGHEDSEKPRRKSAGDHAGPMRKDVSPQPNRLRKLSKSEAATERKRSSSSSPVEKDEQSNHGKEKAAAGAAAGANVFGLLHRKRNSVNERPQEAGDDIRGPFSAEAGGAGPAGEAPQHVEEVTTPFEHPREPPMPPPEEHGAHAGWGEGHGKYNVLASGTPSGVMHAKSSATKGTEGTVLPEPGNYNKLASGTPSGVATPAYKATRSDVGAENTPDYNERASSGAPAPAPTRKDVVASHAGDYNVLKSSGTSAAEGQTLQGSSGVVTHEPGNYNTLSSDTASGIKPHSTPSTARPVEHASAIASHSNRKDDKAEYNVLPSGTPSGVKVKPRSPRQSNHPTDTVTQSPNQSRQGQYNTLPSGTASGINRDSDITSRAQDLNKIPLPSTAATHIRPESQDAIPSHLKPPHQQHHHPNPSQESVPGITTYGHPEPEPDMPQHHMSPEVMPEAYTAFVPRSSHGQGEGRGHQAQAQDWQRAHYSPERTAMMQGMATHEMSPGAMMPSIYDSTSTSTSTAPRAHPSQLSGQEPGGGYQYPATRQMAEGMSPEAMPAAYTSSVHAPPLPGQYGQGTGQGMGLKIGQGVGLWSGNNGGVGRVVHRCQHCGGENDISGYLERVLQERS